MKSFGFLIAASILSLSMVGCLSSPVSDLRSPAVYTSVLPLSTQQQNDPQEFTGVRYEPMVNFLQENNLSLRDWNRLSEAHSNVMVIDQKSQIRLSYMQSLEELMENAPPASIEEAIENTKNRRRLHRELRRLDRRN